MIPVLLFPQFDPVIVQLGPFAIRWYALAYIAGLVLGWRLLRYLVQQPPAVATAVQVDDFLTWATLGVVLGGRLGYVLFYQPSVYLAHPAMIFAVWEGGMSFHGGDARRDRGDHLVLPTQRHPAAGLRRPHRGGRADRAGLRADRQLHQRRAVGPAGAGLAALGDDLPATAGPVPRHPSQLYEALLEGLVLFVVMFALVAPRAPARAVRLADRGVPDRLRRSHASPASASASRTRSWDT